jgi:uncharacterized membrane protein HdeD (DUF308 family)
MLVPASYGTSFAHVLATFLFAEGLVDVYFSTPKMGGSRWILLDGIITLILGLMIWSYWPDIWLSIIGLPVGISMLLTGTTRLMMAVNRSRVPS